MRKGIPFSNKVALDLIGLINLFFNIILFFFFLFVGCSFEVPFTLSMRYQAGKECVIIKNCTWQKRSKNKTAWHKPSERFFFLFRFGLLFFELDLFSSILNEFFCRSKRGGNQFNRKISLALAYSKWTQNWHSVGHLNCIFLVEKWWDNICILI